MGAAILYVFIFIYQIDAADKKLKATCEFLDEQAAEREQERDEAQKEIQYLKDQLREKEKDRASFERINDEVCTRLFRLFSLLL